MSSVRAVMRLHGIRSERDIFAPSFVCSQCTGVAEEAQSQSPIHTPSQPARKTTKEDVQKEVLWHIYTYHPAMTSSKCPAASCFKT